MSTTPRETAEPALAALLTATTPTVEHLAALRAHLALAAEAEAVLDVAYTTIDTPVGSLLLAATPQGLARVAYEREDHDLVLDTIAARSAPASCALRGVSMPRPERSTSTSPASAPGSTSRWTFPCPAASGCWCSDSCPRSPTATPGPTKTWPRSSATPRPSEPSGRHARPTPSPSSSRVTACCGPTAPSAGTSVAPTPRPPC